MDEFKRVQRRWKVIFFVMFVLLIISLYFNFTKEEGNYQECVRKVNDAINTESFYDALCTFSYEYPVIDLKLILSNGTEVKK